MIWLCSSLYCNLISVVKFKLCVIRDHLMRRPFGKSQQRSRSSSSKMFNEKWPLSIEWSLQRMFGIMGMGIHLIRFCVFLKRLGVLIKSVVMHFRAKQIHLSSLLVTVKLWIALILSIVVYGCWLHYFQMVVDDANRGTWVYLMKEKSEVS